MNKVKKMECLQNIESLDNLFTVLYEADMDLTNLNAFKEDFENAQCILINLKSLIEEEKHE